MDIPAILASHSPQPTGGALPYTLHAGILPDGRVGLWDSRQTSGYICAVRTWEELTTLLHMEDATPGSVRAFASGESNYLLPTPPHPDQDTFEEINLDTLTL